MAVDDLVPVGLRILLMLDLITNFKCHYSLDRRYLLVGGCVIRCWRGRREANQGVPRYTINAEPRGSGSGEKRVFQTEPEQLSRHSSALIDPLTLLAAERTANKLHVEMFRRLRVSAPMFAPVRSAMTSMLRPCDDPPRRLADR